MIETLWIVSLCVLLLVIALRLATKTVPLKRVTIFEYQKGLKYTRGRYAETLNAGTYWFFPFFSYIAVVDIRPQFVSVQGQEVLSADGVSLKVSLAAAFEVSDPHIAINKKRKLSKQFVPDAANGCPGSHGQGKN